MADPVEPRASESGGLRMTIAQHLDELRRRLVRAGIGVGLAFAVAYFFGDGLVQTLLQPHYRACESLQLNWDRRDARKIVDDLAKERSEAAPLLASIRERIDAEKFEEILLAVRRENADPQALAVLDEAGRRFASRARELVDPRPIVTTYTESIGVYLKVCLIVALLIAGPYVLWEIWGFIAAGLFKREKTTMRRVFPLALFLFFSGMAFGFFIMLPVSLEYLINFSSEYVRPQVRMAEYFDLFFMLTFALGLIFQLPLVMMILSRLGVVQPQAWREKWKIVLVGCFFASAVATPTVDPINQSLLALSMYVLYELGVLLAKLSYRERQKAAESLNHS